MKLMGNKASEETKVLTAAALPATLQPETVALVKQASGGNFEAFGKLYSIFLDRIYRYVFYQVRDKMTAEDITEEVFLKAWKAIDTCQGREATFSAWLYRIAHNHLLNTIRNQQKYTTAEEDSLVDTRDPRTTMETSVEYHELLDGISRLPQNQQQVIILKFIEGMNNREISQITGQTEGAIRIMQMRALMTLREKFSGGTNNASGTLSGI